MGAPTPIRYARISTDDRDLALHSEEMRTAGCEPTFFDKRSGTKPDRAGLAKALSHLRLLAGDMLRLDVARNLGVSVPTLYRWVLAASR